MLRPRDALHAGYGFQHAAHLRPLPASGEDH